MGPLSPTFWVSGHTLYDPCAQPVILRGINEMVTFLSNKNDLSAYTQNLNSVYTQIAQTGANSVRLYWQTTDSAELLDAALTSAEAQQLIPVIYAFNDASTTTPVSDAAKYWTQPDFVTVVQKHQDWLIIALREKNLYLPPSSVETADEWATNYDAAVARIRTAGVNVPLAIDAPNFDSDNYGSDIDTLLSSGANGGLARFASDPAHNLLLSVNAWATTFSNDFATAAQSTPFATLPIIVGEMSGYVQPGCPSAQFEYADLMATAQATGTGWFAWSWGAVKNAYCPGGYLEMTSDGTYAGLISKAGWGYEVAVSDSNSIKNTAKPSAYTPGSACPASGN